MNSFVINALILCLTHWAFESSAEHSDKAMDFHGLPKPLTSKHSERIHGQFMNQTSRRRRDLREITVQNKVLHYQKVDAYWNAFMHFNLLLHAGYIKIGHRTPKIYVARVLLKDEVIPAQWRVGDWKDCLYTNNQASFNCTKLKIEYLGWSRFYEWIPRYNGDVCNGAVIGGMTRFFEKTYICRFNYTDTKYKIESQAMGKLEPRTGVCSVPSWENGREIRRPNYEVLRDKRYSDLTIDKRFAPLEYDYY